MNKALIIFIKNPLKGRVKTRLAATVGATAALEIYQKLLAHTHSVAGKVNADKYLFYSVHIDANDDWKETEFVKEVQTGSHLGERMQNAFESLFRKGYKQVAIIGSDCPGMTTDLINQAFEELERIGIVIGPANDGGYYLLALKKLHVELFTNISWSTPQVLEHTIEVCNRINEAYYLLPLLSDVDVEDDFVNNKEFFLKK